MRPDSLLAIPSLLSAAVARRRGVAEARGLEAYRLVNGPADAAPEGLTLDRYAGWRVLGVRAGTSSEVIEGWAAAAAAGAEGVVVKTWARVPADSSSRVWSGPPSPVVKVREGDVNFICELDQGPPTGLFLDHRETRFGIRPYAVGAEVLNLFAYTGSFSVHAAKAGAKRVTSVDVAKRALQRARENMVASGLDPDQHRWFPDDVLKHLQRPQPPRYGLVIADPPLYGHAGGARFSLLRDLERLWSGVLARLLPGGVAVFSTHATSLDHATLEAAAARAASALGRPIEVLHRWGLPEWDHPAHQAPSAADRGDYLSTLVLRAG